MNINYYGQWMALLVKQKHVDLESNNDQARNIGAKIQCNRTERQRKMSAAVSVSRSCLSECIDANLTCAAHFRAILFSTVRTIRPEQFRQMEKSSWIGRGNPSNEQSMYGHLTTLPVNLQPIRRTKHPTKFMRTKRTIK
jgi:hypothetical protein